MNKPTAYITQNRQRVRQYSNSIYLKDGDTFELELFNPTRSSVLAKINLNGNPISTSGVVINPGQRVFLERYLDSPNKFVFQTYEVDGSDVQVQRAIIQNGIVSVEFFAEKTIFQNYIYTDNNTVYRSGTIPTPYDWFTTCNLQNTTGVLNTKSFNSTNVCCSDNSYDVSYECPDSTSTTIRGLLTDSPTSKQMETGQVGKGDYSNQNFRTVNKEFEYHAFETVIWKILPLSQKPYEVSDEKIYCANCGKKRKPNENFCPKCGNKF